MTTTIEVHTPLGAAHLTRPELDGLSEADLARLTVRIQADVDAGPCLNVWHPNCSVGCAPAPSGAPESSVSTRPGVAAGRDGTTSATSYKSATVTE